MAAVKRKQGIHWLVLGLVLLETGCTPRAYHKPPVDHFEEISEIAALGDITGHQAKEGHFYFTAMDQGGFAYYSLDLVSKEVRLLFDGLENYLSFIPIDEKRAIYVNGESQLIYWEGEKKIRLDEGISGLESPNVMVSPDGSRVLYTKGMGEEAALYHIQLPDGSPKRVIGNLEEEAFKTFHFTTQWSNQGKYFTYYHQQVFDADANLVASFLGTSSKWSPTDEYIAFIKIPPERSANAITIGEWDTFVGRELMIYELESGKETIVFSDAQGFIDPVESIQWSPRGGKVAISHGKIVEQEDYLEKLHYDKILVYHLATQEKSSIEPMAYNYYDFLQEDILYGNNLGVKEALEVVSLRNGSRTKFNGPVILNSQDMYGITHGERAYMVDGQQLLEFDEEGKHRVLMNLPWELYSLYFDQKTETFVMVNRDQQLFIVPRASL